MIRKGPWILNPNWINGNSYESLDESVLIMPKNEAMEPLYSVMLTLDEIKFICEARNEHDQ
jgi:hypothetical protein